MYYTQHITAQHWDRSYIQYIVVGPLAVYLLFSDAEHNSHYSISWLEFVAVEISLSFFVAELFTSLTLSFFPDAFYQG